MNAFINYVSFPYSAKQLKNKIDDDDMTDMENLVKFKYHNWTISPIAKEGDLVIFFHTRNVLNRIKNIEQEVIQNEDIYKDLKNHIDLSYEYFEKYGSSIFAVGIVASEPEVDNNAFDYKTHFKERCFSDIDNVQVLDKPIKTNQFLSFFNLKTQKSQEPIAKDIFKKLIKIIKETNTLSKEIIEKFDLFEKE